MAGAHRSFNAENPSSLYCLMTDETRQPRYPPQADAPPRVTDPCLCLPAPTCHASDPRLSTSFWANPSSTPLSTELHLGP